MIYSLCNQKSNLSVQRLFYSIGYQNCSQGIMTLCTRKYTQKQFRLVQLVSVNVSINSFLCKCKKESVLALLRIPAEEKLTNNAQRLNDTKRCRKNRERSSYKTLVYLSQTLNDSEMLPRKLYKLQLLAPVQV